MTTETPLPRSSALRFDVVAGPTAAPPAAVFGVRDGAPTPLGATWLPEEQAWNFALYSRHATGVTLLLYGRDDPVAPVLELALDPARHKTGRIWHCRVPVARAPGATLYAYRVSGPRHLDEGHRFDPDKILLDPYARAVCFPAGYSRDACSAPGPTDGGAPLGALPGEEPPFDWGRDPRPHHAHDAVIYELHVKGFTARANSGVPADRRGTFAGLIEKIPYLKELGVTLVELLPIHQFDPQEGNYWGYMTLNFMAPHHAYAAGDDAAREFRDLVRALHEAGIEVVLDVVYNHTSESGEHGPTYSFRGIDNRSYYLLQPDLRTYVNDTGCGNTTRCANPATRALVLSSLQRWARDFRVDGFRFDLASIFTRNGDGTINTTDPPLVAEIGFLASSLGLRLIAEAWDISAYQLGRGFPGLLWMQWNGRYRDDLRGFVKGDPGLVGALMCRLYGSDDLFPGTVAHACRPQQSVNFVTAHDGFCLYDLVSYHDKRNRANGHDNTDGANDNRGWNCGWEGDEGAPPDVRALRTRQVKNFCCLLMLSNGVPMFGAGDEFLQTQGGNNNPYNQDNETTWLDWDLLARNRDVFRFFQRMIAFRKAHPSIGRGRFWRDDVTWYGVTGAPDLSPDSRTLAYCLRGASERDADLYVMINAYWEPLRFRIEAAAPTIWRRVVDTSLPSPADILDPGAEVDVDRAFYDVGPRSVVVLVARPGDA
jgi:glycogen operon protein